MTDMGFMFYDASDFDQDLSGWCVSSVVEREDFSAFSRMDSSDFPPFGTSNNCQR